MSLYMNCQRACPIIFGKSGLRSSKSDAEFFAALLSGFNGIVGLGNVSLQRDHNSSIGKIGYTPRTRRSSPRFSTLLTPAGPQS